jgi:glutamyl-tRNA synthetase
VTVPAEVRTRALRLALENAVAHDGAARVEPIVGRLLATDPTLRPLAAELRDLVSAVVADVLAIPGPELADRLAQLGGPEAARPREAASTGGDFPDLVGAVPGKVVLRLAPFPSGALHIGHGRMLFINQHYREQYRGKIYLVFDDTIGSEEKRVETEFFGLIEEDLASAGVRPDAVYYKSDRIPNFYPWARRVIDKGGAYVCTCPAELLRENRAHGVACAHRT